MICFGVVPGLRLEVLADNWAAFSPASGDTLLLNTEAAAVLELLADGPMSAARVCECLVADTGAEAGEVEASLQLIWPQMLTAGFVQIVGAAADNGE